MIEKQDLGCKGNFGRARGPPGEGICGPERGSKCSIKKKWGHHHAVSAARSELRTAGVGPLPAHTQVAYSLDKNVSVIPRIP